MKISIDCWGTLIKGSPTFSQKKIELVKKYFPEISNDEYIHACFDRTKKIFNEVIERSGGIQPSMHGIFQYLFTTLAQKYATINSLNEFIDKYQELAVNYPPVLYSDDTFEYVKKLSMLGDLILSSNTMFISGHTLRECLANHQLMQYFTKVMFSDQQECAKPNPKMYCESNFHIGDNPLTDGIGAKNAGATPIIINSNNKTIADAYTIITQGK